MCRRARRPRHMCLINLVCENKCRRLQLAYPDNLSYNMTSPEEQTPGKYRLVSKTPIALHTESQGSPYNIGVPPRISQTRSLINKLSNIYVYLGVHPIEECGQSDEGIWSI